MIRPGLPPHNFCEVTGSCTTGKPGARLASGAQLWRLNQLGILSEALNAEEPVSADRARELLRQAASRGLWTPPPRWDLPVRKRLAVH